MEEQERRAASGRPQDGFESLREIEIAYLRERELSYRAGDGLHVLNP